MKISKYLFMLILLTGCDTIFYPAYFKNAYFKDIYVTDYAKSLEEETFVRFFSGGGVYELASHSSMALSPIKIDFFQEENGSCFLYSYTREELRKLKLDSGFSLSDSEAVFLMEKNKVRIVSMEEYERIKTTLKPHPFDPSLCKPKPADANDTK